MKLTSGTQEALLALLCFDEVNGRIVASLVPGHYYDAVYREVAELAIDYWERFREPPSGHTLDLFDQCAQEQPEREELFYHLHESVESTAQDGLNAVFMIERARAFVRYQALKRGLGKAVRALEGGDEESLLKVEQAWEEAMKHRADVFDAGVDFLVDSSRSLSFMNAEDQQALPTGIVDLDKNGLGPTKGALHLFVGPPKCGKTWWFVNLMTRANQAAKKALGVSLELSEEAWCRRLTQSFLAVGKRDVGKFRYRRFRRGDDPRSWGADFDLVDVDNVRNLANSGDRKRIIRDMGRFRDNERLIVKKYPMGSLTTSQLEAYLDLLESRERFVPELVCVDYADIMKLPDGDARWEAILLSIQELKRIADERHIAVATASQVKVSGARARRTDTQHVAGAWDKVATADVVLTYSKTDEEAEDRLARLFVAAARDEKDRFEILLSQSYDTGQFALSSIRLGSGYYQRSDEDEDTR